MPKDAKNTKANNKQSIDLLNDNLLNKKYYLTNLKTKNGITLIALIVTIIVLLILAGVTINRVFSEGGIIDQTKRARFTYTIRALEEAANVQDTGRYFEENIQRKDVIPNNGELTKQEKDEITKNVPTLAESVYLATSETLV